MPSVTVRPLHARDIPAVAGWIAATPLWQRYRFSAPQAEASLARALAQADILLVADVEREGGQACGLAWCLPAGAFGRSPYLRILGVRAGLTGLGIGAALLDRLEQVAAERASDLFLLVSDFNQAARRFYQRQGYRQVGAIPGYVLPDVTELIFWKRLRQSG